ncbi:DUF4283 domain-containing protein [Cephalotus follicularis]|uniref:DUF4283 domain-containing protein n=1 Tax=Cephalotus follicularis TaxID=3775 RepID=A0A1Q3CI50_CEPFO|nr:DUF4283 domain-containing protein [Cephalotus follicularis]
MPAPGPPPLVGAPPPTPATGDLPSVAGGLPPTPAPPLQTFASLLGSHPLPPPFCPLSSLPNIPPIHLSQVSTTTQDGLPLITFSPDDFQAAAAFNQLTLLAKFSSSAPHVNVFDVHVNTAWGLSQPATVGSLDPRHISIQLHSMDDLSIAWSRFSRTFNGQPFLLLRWSAAYKRHDSPQSALWMRLPGLPLPLHNPSFLKAIGDSLGRFLRSDDFTLKLKNPRVARL